MKPSSVHFFCALAAGSILALMINFNSSLAKSSTPVFASWLAHGLGAFAAFIFVQILSRRKVTLSRNPEVQKVKNALWNYSGGIAGAFTVILAAITVNSELGLAGSFALMLVGQILFGTISDLFGLFVTSKRRLAPADFQVVLCVLVGSGLIIYFRS